LRGKVCFGTFALNVFSTALTLHLIKRIALEPGPDAGIYDPKTRIFYIGNGGRGAKTDL
jgi:hypothetical protein